MIQQRETWTQDMLKPLATYSTAHTNRQETWRESTKYKITLLTHQEKKRSDSVVKPANPRLSVRTCTPRPSTRNKALKSSKIMEHFEPRNHLDGWWVSVSQTWTSYIEAQHRIQLLESYFHFQYFKTQFTFICPMHW